MDPITIDLSGLGKFGPHLYLFSHLTAAVLLGAVSHRHVSAAGQCHGAAGQCHGAAGYSARYSRDKEERFQKMKGNSHVANAILVGVFGLANVIVALVMSVQLFDRAFEATNPPATAITACSKSHYSDESYVITASNGKTYTNKIGEKMEPVTINLQGLSELFQFGPSGYIAAFSFATTVCWMICWWHTKAAGRCHGAACGGQTAKMKMDGNSHIARAIASGVIGLINVIFTMTLVYEAFMVGLKDLG